MRRIGIFLLPLALAASACEKPKSEPPPPPAPPPAKPTTVTPTTSTTTALKKEEYGGGQHEHDKERELEAVARTLGVALDGKALGEKTVAELDALPGAKVEDGKHTWPLRELAKSFGGKKARVTAVVSDSGEKLSVDKAAWADMKRAPTLRSNRRGDIKFQWEQNGTAMAMEPELRGIRSVELTAK